MPLFWIVVLTVGGLVVLTRLATPSSPSGKAWPAGTTAQTEAQAVSIALARETEPAKLRAFARALDAYDKPSAQKLYRRALVLQVATTHSASTADTAFSQLAAITVRK